MKNIGLGKYKLATANNFTSAIGLKIRKKINKPLRFVMKKATKRKIIFESYPKLEEGKPYIFASTHSFDEDIISSLASIDRNAYVLIGTTNQLDYNPTMYVAWLNGMIYVNRLDEESRKSSVEKMKTVLEAGTSVLLFPEGGWNNTENLLVQKLFAGPYILAKLTGAQVVPISTYNEMGTDNIYMSFGEPLDFSNMDKKESLELLRDSMATMMYKQIETHSTPICRSKLSENARLEFMEKRKKEYLRVKWTEDPWEEELTVYKDKEHPLPVDVRASFDDVNVTIDNAHTMGPILLKRLEDEKYDFKKYMHENWKK